VDQQTLFDVAMTAPALRRDVDRLSGAVDDLEVVMLRGYP
jgi:hypothetical protein